MVSDTRHDLALIETKPGALDQAAALQCRVLPSSFAHIRRNVIGEAVKYSQTA